MKDEFVDLSHGGGGKRMDTIISFLTKKIDIKNETSDLVGPLDADDSSIVNFQSNNLVLTTDSHTVDPIFFRGGNIGDLAVCGTINDITVMGAQPLYLTLGIIIEEGYSIENLGKIAETIGRRCRESNVRIITGDTKIMPKGMVSNCIINTTGVGKLIREVPIRDSGAIIGDAIIQTGSIGDHGMSLMALREGFEFDTTLESDVASFWPAFKDIITNPAIHCMKDLTRGGLASGINEIAMKSKLCMVLKEDLLLVREESQAIADLLGLEIMEISCEGSAIMIVDKNHANEILTKLKKIAISKNARIIGHVKENPKGQVHVITNIGGTRILDKPYGEPIPRVC